MAKNSTPLLTWRNDTWNKKTKSLPYQFTWRSGADNAGFWELGTCVTGGVGFLMSTYCIHCMCCDCSCVGHLLSNTNFPLRIIKFKSNLSAVKGIVHSNLRFHPFMTQLCWWWRFRIHTTVLKFHRGKELQPEEVYCDQGLQHNKKQ